MDEMAITLAEALKFGGIDIPAGAQLQLSGNQLFYNGSRLELGLTTADVHDPTELPTYLAGYSNEEFRWSEACPEVLVEMDSDKYRTFNTNAAFAPVIVKTTDEAYPNEVKVESSLTPYKVQPRRLAAFIPDTVRQQAGQNYNVEYVHMARCARAINMDLEIDVFGPSGLLVTAGNWTANYSLALGAGLQWGGPAGVGANSDPILNLDERIEQSATRITDWWMNQKVASAFLRHPKVRDHLKTEFGDAGYSTAIKAVAEAGEKTVDFRIVGKGLFHVVAAKWANPNNGGAIEYIMPNVVVGTHNFPGVPMNGEKIATCKNFRRRGPAGNGFNTRQIRIEQRGAGGTLVIVEEASIPTMTSSIAGGLLTGIIQ